MITAPAGAQRSFGRRIVSGGDLNGDGFADLVIASGEAGELGAMSVVFGSTTGDLRQAVNSIGLRPDELFAENLHAAGDINGDGYGDLAVLSTNSTGTGRVLLYFGGPMGLRSTPEQTWDLSNESARVGTVLRAADFDGDGFHDLVVGIASASGDRCQLRVASGGSGGLALNSARVVQLPLTCPEGALSGAVMGDADQDGLPDLIVTGADQGRALVLVLRGGSAGLAMSALTRWANPVPMGPTLFNPMTALAAGDVSGDGRIDVLLQTRIRTLTGPAQFVTTILDRWHEGEMALPMPLASRFASAVIALADYTGDAIADYVEGDRAADGGSGVVNIYAGRAGGPASTPTRMIRAPSPDVIGFGATLAQ